MRGMSNNVILGKENQMFDSKEAANGKTEVLFTSKRNLILRKMIVWAYDLKTKKRTSEMVMDNKLVEEGYLEESVGLLEVRSTS